MNDDKLTRAETEAMRLLNRIQAYRKAVQDAPSNYYWPRESGAVKRASMDLTRALADLRKPQS